MCAHTNILLNQFKAKEKKQFDQLFVAND